MILLSQIHIVLPMWWVQCDAFSIGPLELLGDMSALTSVLGNVHNDA